MKANLGVERMLRIAAANAQALPTTATNGASETKV